MPDETTNITTLRPIGAGHNQPILTLIGEPDILKAQLGRDYAKLVARFVEIEQGIARIPAGAVKDEAAAQRIVDFVAQQCRPVGTEAKSAHEKEKRPYLGCGRVIDDFFLRRIDRLNVLVAGVTSRADAYYKAKKAAQRREEERQRQNAAALQRQQAAEAHRLAEEARRTAAAGDRQGAVELGVMAEEASAAAAASEVLAHAPPAPVRIHGDYGATLFGKEDWTYEVDNPGLIPPGYLMPDHVSIMAAIGEGVRDIPGLRIFPIEKSIIRRC
jgi:hypothetical protein